MASATATAKPDPAPQGEAGNGREGGDERVGWRRRLTGLWPPGSRLGRLIILLNLIGLAVLICGALVLNELRRGLVEARIDSLTTQGEFIVKVLDETATVGDPAPALQAAEASDFLQILFIPRGQRARLFDANGQLVADSYAVADRVESTVLPPARRPGEKALLDPMQLKPKPDDRAISDLSREIAHALSGQRVAGMRRSETGRRVVSVSLPIQHVEAVLGVLTLEAGDVDQTIRAQRAAMIPFILIAIATMLTSSLLLNRLVARPVLRLAHAADRVRLAGEREISLPDIARRDDELGDLARALEDMTQSLYERMDATERFAADVAHEIRNPLTSIRSAVETLDLVTDQTARQRLLAIVKHDAGRLDRLVTDISNASRIDSELSREPSRRLDMDRLLSEVAQLYEAQVKPGRPGPAGVHVRFLSPAPHEPFRVMGQDSPLGQVLRNLIDNARSFSPEGGEVRVALSRAKGRILTTVEDDGPGIPPENLETVFERFYTSRPKGQAFGCNSGLGLSIARQIAVAHSGELRAENRRGADGAVIGARFILDLPEA